MFFFVLFFFYIYFFSFFLDVLQHKKSTYLEWIIIVLIAAEMFIGIAGLVLQMQDGEKSAEKVAVQDS